MGNFRARQWPSRITRVWQEYLVSRILDAGGNIVGKTVCENLCYSGASFTAATGPVVNPYNNTRMAGGSSSGSAALVRKSASAILQENSHDFAVTRFKRLSLNRVKPNACGLVVQGNA